MDDKKSTNAASRETLAAPHLDVSENEVSSTPPVEAALTTSEPRRRFTVHNRRSRPTTRVSPSYVWSLKAIVVLLVLVLTKYYTARYVKCLRRASVPDRGNLPTTENGAKSGLNVLRRLAVGYDDISITASSVAGDSLTEAPAVVCQREMQEEMEDDDEYDEYDEVSLDVFEEEIPVQVSPPELPSEIRTCTAESAGELYAALSFAGIGMGTFMFIVAAVLYDRAPLEKTALWTSIAAGVLLGLSFVALVGGALTRYVRRTCREETLLSRVLARKGLQRRHRPAIDPEVALERGENAEGFSVLNPTEENFIPSRSSRDRLKTVHQEKPMHTSCKAASTQEIAPLNDVDTGASQRAGTSPVECDIQGAGTSLVHSAATGSPSPSRDMGQSGEPVPVKGTGQSEGTAPVEGSAHSAASTAVKGSGQGGASALVEGFGQSGAHASVESSGDNEAPTPV